MKMYDVIQQDNKLLQFFALIDKIYPICLYCQSECQFEGKGLLNSLFIKNTYFCSQCREKFVIVCRFDKEYSFTFTCSNLRIEYIQFSNKFNISKLSDKTYISIPDFPLDFSNKESLYNKLKTYLIFI